MVELRWSTFTHGVWTLTEFVFAVLSGDELYSHYKMSWGLKERSWLVTGDPGWYTWLWVRGGWKKDEIRDFWDVSKVCSCVNLMQKKLFPGWRIHIFTFVEIDPIRYKIITSFPWCCYIPFSTQIQNVVSFYLYCK